MILLKHLYLLLLPLINRICKLGNSSNIHLLKKKKLSALYEGCSPDSKKSKCILKMLFVKGSLAIFLSLSSQTFGTVFKFAE